MTLAVRNRVSRRETTELARELFGVELATGTVDAIVQRAGEALAAPHTRLEQEIKRSAVVNIDETGWKTKGERRTLWGALTSQTAVFRIAAGRHASEAQTMLGERYRRDRLFRPLRRLRLPRPDPPSALLGAPAQRLHRPQRRNGRASTVRSRRPRCRHRPLQRLAAVPARRQPRQASPPHQAAPGETPCELEHASRKSARTKYHRQFARNLLKRWPALWTFTHTHGVEPTNNHAERGLRGAVIHRKLSLGSQSERGERTIERLLSASITCRLRKQSLYDYLTQVITAHARGDPIPSLN